MYRNGVEVWRLDLTGSEYNTVVGSFEHGNNHSGTITGEEFIDNLSDCQLLKKNSVSWDELVTC
jgi:hypothetical protein